MASYSWLLVGLLCAVSVAEPDKSCSEGEQCGSESHQDQEDILGHALLATRVVRTKILDDTLLPVEATGLEAAREHIQTVEELRKAVLTQGSATPEQLQQLFGFTLDALNEKVDREPTPPSILLQANGTHEANGTQPFNGEFKGDNDPIAARDRYDKDYIRNNDDGLIPGLAKEENKTYDIPTGDAHEKKYVLATYIVGPLALVFTTMFTLSNVMEKYEITAIPESGIMIVAGVVLGLLLKRYAHFSFFEDVDAFGEMNSAVLNMILLPIIIFASGWALRRQDFYSQFPYILMFAMIGVAISTIVIACLVFWTGYLGLHNVTRWRTAFAFASLISATDPVATLSTYTKLKVDPLLNILVFGESIINDAVAIVLFNVFNADDYMIGPKGEALQGFQLVWPLCWGTLRIFFGSSAIGIGLGILYTFVSFWADMRHNKKGQILVIFASCYLTYALAESVGMSGIIAEMFAAIIMGVYMRSHLSAEGSMLATFFVKQVAMLADAAVCLLIGVSVVQLTSKGLYFGLWAMLFCLIGRACAVFPVGISVNIVKQQIGRANGEPEEGWNLLTPQHMFMMWHAGLRGAIALALSLELGTWVDDVDGPGTRTSLQTATFLIIVTFLLVFGGSTSSCLKHLKVPNGIDRPTDYLSKTEDYGPLRGALKWLDKAVLAPLLTGSHTADEEEEMDVEDRLKAFHKFN